LILGFVYANSDAIRCPSVFDGLTNGQFDMSTQFSLNTLSSNWVGLESDDVIGYEWAVVSESKAAKLSSGCRTTQGFNGIPDIQDWTSVSKRSSAVNNRLSLTSEKTYFVVLRTTLANGVQVYSNSDGIIVLPESLQPKERSVGKESRSEETNTQSRETRNSQNPARNYVLSGESCFPYSDVCEIDNENRCRQSKLSVHDYLDTIYGKARFPVITPLPAIVPVELERRYNDDEDDDEGDNNNGIVVATVVGGFLFFLIPLLCLCCIACLVNRNDDDDKFTDRVVAQEVEVVDSQGGSFTQHSLGPENTKVEFPDIDPHNRLSVA